MIRVLVADDHAVVRRGLIQILEEGDDIHVKGEAGTAREVIQALREDDYDVLVLDVAMPEGGGLEVLEYLDDGGDEIHVLVLSVYPEKQYARRALKLGAKGYLTKDSAPQELLMAVEKVARGELYLTQTLAEELAASLRSNHRLTPHQRLSDREYQVMTMIAEGKTTSQIAEILALSVKTVSTYRRRMLDKLDLETTADIVRYAIEHDIGKLP